MRSSGRRIRLKGGFAGNGAAHPDQRDVAAYKTILSGDLNGDPTIVVGDSAVTGAPVSTY